MFFVTMIHLGGSFLPQWVLSSSYNTNKNHSLMHEMHTKKTENTPIYAAICQTKRN